MTEADLPARLWRSLKRNRSLLYAVMMCCSSTAAFSNGTEDFALLLALTTAVIYASKFDELRNEHDPL